MTIDGLFTWDGGTVSVSTLRTQGTGDLNTAGTKMLTSSWVNAGVTSFSDGILDLSGSAVVTNNDSFDIATTDPSDTIQGSGHFGIGSNGTLHKPGGGCDHVSAR